MTSDIHKDQEGARTKPRGLIPRSHFFVLGTRLMWWSPILLIQSMLMLHEVLIPLPSISKQVTKKSGWGLGSPRAHDDII